MIIQKKQKGFTLIELMIVIAIVGILAAVAVPMYANYTNKAKFSEVRAALGPAKTAVELCFQTAGALSSCGTAAAIGVNTTDLAVGTHVGSVTVSANGVLQATASGLATTEPTYTLTPTAVGTSLSWAETCSDTTLC